MEHTTYLYSIGN